MICAKVVPYSWISRQRTRPDGVTMGSWAQPVATDRDGVGHDGGGRVCGPDAGTRSVGG